MRAHTKAEIARRLEHLEGEVEALSALADDAGMVTVVEDIEAVIEAIRNAKENFS